MSRLWAGIIVAFVLVILPTAIALIDHLCVGCERKRSRETVERINSEHGEISCTASICDEIADKFLKVYNVATLRWEEEPEDSEGDTQGERKELHARVCPNCGAPVRGGKCEYCGTVFTQPNDEMRSYPLPPHWMDWREYHERIDPGRTIRFYNPETHTWEWVGEDAMKQVVMRNGRRN